jgi:CheY-like chemotaxis protein/DNA-binding XRE family transcriptional regulator
MSIAEQSDHVYAFIGQRIRERRKLLKLSQTELAELMGFSYQQMQKYETGVSRVTAGKLLQFAKILNVPPSYFYDGLKLEEAVGSRIRTDIIQRRHNRALHILLIEDNASDVLLFKRTVATNADKVLVNVLHDGPSALEFLHNHHDEFDQPMPDLVVLDLSLPRMGGMDVLKSIKKNPKTLELPVVILTNSINVKEMMESYRHGAAGFIQKVIEPEEYREAVETMVKYWSKTVALPCG